MIQPDQTVQVIDKMFNARSVAVVGASNDPHKFGFMTLSSIIRGGFEGRLYPVNPKGGKIQGLVAYRSLSEIRDDVDLVVILVPAKHVPGLLVEAANKRVAGVVICSGGFRESGRYDLEAEIASIAAERGLRLIGPNVAGVNYLPNKLCAMFFPVITAQGPLAIVSQSGTVTNGLSEWAADEGLGISAAINLGNQVDLCESDFLKFLAFDKHTRAMLLYIEGLRDTRHFLDTIRQTTQVKPLVVLKAGRTEAGKRSAASHSGSLAASYDLFSATCHQFGAVVADDVETLYDYGKALALMRLPKGRRVFSISTSGGAGTLAADTSESLGLVLPRPPEEFLIELRKLPLSPLASFSNPLDNGADLNADIFRRVALLVDRFDIADVLLINFGDPVPGAAEMLRELAHQVKASLVVSYFAGGDEEKLGRVQIQKDGLPVFPTPERAMRGISAVVWVAQYLRTRHPKHIDQKE
jgi:acyl-CoA synthetase (NDP forming)